MDRSKKDIFDLRGGFEVRNFGSDLGVFLGRGGDEQMRADAAGDCSAGIGIDARRDFVDKKSEVVVLEGSI